MASVEICGGMMPWIAGSSPTLRTAEMKLMTNLRNVSATVT